jgi:hypothetical protein
MAVTLTLGGIAFSGFEIPEKINFGGRQNLVTHKLVGGKRIIDAMGRDDDDIAWAGRFRGSNAKIRAQALDGLRISGAPQTLGWDGFSYSVIIKEFKADYTQSYEIPYTVTCEVVQDNRNPLASFLFSIDAAIGEALNGLGAIASKLGLPNVTTAISSISSAASTITVEGASNNDVIGINGALDNAKSIVSGVLSNTDVQTLSGNAFVSGADPANAASTLTAQANSFLQSADLRNMNAKLGVMAKNISSRAGV